MDLKATLYALGSWGAMFVFLVALPALCGYPRDTLRFMAVSALVVGGLAALLVYGIVATAP